MHKLLLTLFLRPTKTAWHELFEVLKEKQILHKIINIGIQRAVLNIVGLLPLLEQIRAVSLDALLRHIVPLTLKHFQYFMLKAFGDKTKTQSFLHPDFIKKLAECREQDDFTSLANEIKQVLEQPSGLQQITKMVQV